MGVSRKMKKKNDSFFTAYIIFSLIVIGIIIFLQIHSDKIAVIEKEISQLPHRYCQNETYLENYTEVSSLKVVRHLTEEECYQSIQTRDEKWVYMNIVPNSCYEMNVSFENKTRELQKEVCYIR